MIAAGKSVATAESCTGGWIAKSLTDIGGSSQCFSYGVVSYSNDAKVSLLGVQAATLHEHGAVSDPVVARVVSAPENELVASLSAMIVIDVPAVGNR